MGRLGRRVLEPINGSAVCQHCKLAELLASFGIDRIELVSELLYTLAVFFGRSREPAHKSCRLDKVVICSFANQGVQGLCDHANATLIDGQKDIKSILYECFARSPRVVITTQNHHAFARDSILQKGTFVFPDAIHDVQIGCTVNQFNPTVRAGTIRCIKDKWGHSFRFDLSNSHQVPNVYDDLGVADHVKVKVRIAIDGYDRQPSIDVGPRDDGPKFVFGLLGHLIERDGADRCIAILAGG